jgi:thiamine-phosphate pyrophosphorylase
MEVIEKKKIASGIYLVVDPSMEENSLLHKLEMILQEKIIALQIWDNFYEGQNVESLIEKITERCHAKQVPVLINNRWQLLNTTSLDGVHFDSIPANFEEIKKQIDHPFIAGITVNNDLSLVHWANKHQLDYISFCSVFPSSTSNSCELVKFETIREAREITSMPIFLAGGIKPENITKLDVLDYDGIAVISGIMSSDQPDQSIKAYYQQLKTNES